jgi:AcrR family transcriptional regulator
MRSSEQSETGWRGSREGWLEAAYETLLESGVDAVRIMPLSKRLALSRTSFYWFFRDRDALLAALIDRWRAKNTGNLVKQAESYAESICEAILNVFDCWLDPSLFDSRFEFAVRSWAHQSPEVAAEIAAADATRLRALADMYRRFGFDPLAADVRSRAIYLSQIGYISMKTEEDVAIRMKRIPEYIGVFAGKPPRASEMDRFFARHGLAAKQPAIARARAS